MISPSYIGDRQQASMRVFEVVLWLDNPDYLKQLEDCKEYAWHWAYCVHDKDFKDDGSPQKPHVHFIMYFRNNRYYSRVAFFVNSFSNENNLWAGDTLRKRVRYLVHADNPEKHQYDISEIKSNFSVERYFCDCLDLNAGFETVCESIYSGEICSIETLIDYCREFHLNSILRRDYRIFKDYIYELNPSLKSKR